MTNNEEQQVIALAATVQALAAVQDVAVKGSFDDFQVLPIFRSLTCYDPEAVIDAFGGDIIQLRFGLGQLAKLFNEELDKDLAQYLLAVIHVERKLVTCDAMRQNLQQALHDKATELNDLSSDTDMFDDSFETFDEDTEQRDDDNELDKETIESKLVSETMIADFAETYKQTASKTEPRIIIRGNQQYLRDAHTANKIRALLLAALRSIGFYRHYGGKRIDLMLKRKQFIDIINRLR